ncbi:Ig-like domain-containing protein, partial [Crocosphaera sp. Alani8]|uniref:Ig-like domain-containing protein n=1 Tax=Crocosphaera sp. Alani8 TaxID=3038952 RepID=UPI00313DA6B2
MVQVSLSTSTNFSGSQNAVIEDQGTVLTFEFTLDEPAPAGGLKVYVDSDVPEIMNRLNNFGQALTNATATASTFLDFTANGFSITITENETSATLTIPVFDNDENRPDDVFPETFDGLTEATFTVKTRAEIDETEQTSLRTGSMGNDLDAVELESNGQRSPISDYTVGTASSTVLFADTASQLPVEIPGYHETVGGDISDDPEDPLDLPLQEGQNLLSATTGPGEADRDYVTITVPEGFQLDSVILEDYSSVGNPAFVGLQQGEAFTENLDNSGNAANLLGYHLFGGSEAEIGTDILDNIGNGAGAIGFNGPLPSGDYTLAFQQLGAFTSYTLEFNVSAVPDNVDPLAVNDSYTATVNETLEIDAEAGVLNNDSDGDGDDLTVEIDSDVTDGDLTLNSDGSFSYTPDQDFTGVDSFSYTVSDGNGGTATADVSINVGNLPIVSFEAIPATISEEGTPEERLLKLAFTVVGDIPEGGLVVLLENLFGITDQADSEDDRGAFNGLTLAPPFDTQNNIIGIRLLENEASIELPMINDLVEETTTFEFQLLDGDGYIVDPDQNGTVFTITDDNGGPGVGPTIGISVSETNLAEGDTFTVNFEVEGEIPQGGVDVLVESTVAVALGQFELSNLNSLQLSGVSNLRPGDDRGLSFIATLTEADASITLEVFDDIIAEESRDIPFTLANGELYEVDPTAESVTLTITDDIDIDGPTVGITIDKTEAVEGETIVLTINTEGEIPDGGLQVLINDIVSAGNGSRSLTEFDIGGVQFTGISGFPTPAEGDSGFFVTVTDPIATITLPVFDDGADEIEEEEVFTFAVIDGEAYGVDPDASDVTLSIVDPLELPTVSISTPTPEVTEDEAPQA